MKQTIGKSQINFLHLLSNFKLTLIGILIFINSLPVAASHIRGGEITWECLGASAGSNAGKYIFQLKLYRDCNGVQFGISPQNIDVVNHPTLSSITCQYVSNTDLSPVGCGYSCSNPQWFLGITEEILFRSGAISLGSNTPPAQGWIFYWGANQCCRNFVDNLTGAVQMIVRSKMFAFNGKPASPCFDSSPFLAQKPITSICIGTSQNNDFGGFDIDSDSLTYGWDYATDGNSWATVIQLPFTPPYTVSSPLPGSPILNSANGNLTINPILGIAPQGNFSSVVRVNSYRCQQKIAEIYRETQINFTSACPLVVTGPNSAPAMNPAPFTDPNTGLNTVYDTTVYAGDVVTFISTLSEYDLNLNFTSQIASMDPIGQEFATNYAASPPDNCNRPPCAYFTDVTPNYPVLVPPISTGSSPFKMFRFFWPTACDHAWIDSCGNNSHTYYFILNAHDDYCPVPAYNSKTVGITVLGPQVTLQGSTLSTNFPNGSLQWYLNGAPIPGATLSSYVVTVAGTYHVAATLPGSNCQAFSAPRTAGTSSIANSQNQHLDITIFPNPASEQITLEINSKEKTDVDFILNDLSGRNVMTKQVIVNEGNNKVGINMTGLQKGIYIARIRSAEMEQIKKLVLE